MVKYLAKKGIAEFVIRDGHQGKNYGLSGIVIKSRLCQFSRHLETERLFSLVKTMNRSRAAF